MRRRTLVDQVLDRHTSRQLIHIDLRPPIQLFRVVPSHMPLFFSLEKLRDSIHPEDGLEVRLLLRSHYGPAQAIELLELAKEMERLDDEGLQGLRPSILYCFGKADLKVFAESMRITCPYTSRIDLGGLAQCLPGLARRDWLPEHFRETSWPQKAQARLGEVSLLAHHFYDDPDSWGYHIYLSLWFADESPDNAKLPPRLLFISSDSNAIHDFGEFTATQERSTGGQGRVFISYVRQDMEMVERLKSDLEARGIAVWLDKADISPGMNWQHAIRKAISEGMAFIACFSTNYAARNKTYMNEELQLAISEIRMMPKDQVWFLPVLLSPCTVPDYDIGPATRLTDLQHVALYQDWNTSIDKIAQVIRETRPKNEES